MVWNVDSNRTNNRIKYLADHVTGSCNDVDKCYPLAVYRLVYRQSDATTAGKGLVSGCLHQDVTEVSFVQGLWNTTW